MVIRTYIEKNNTIVYNSEVNTGRSRIAELFYGGNNTKPDHSRHLLYFDIEDLKTKYNEGKLGDLSKVKHTLKMCNSSTFDENLQAQKLLDGKQRTSSFDLNLFKIKQFWDEGTGLDYQKFKIQQGSNNNITFVESASNWFNATTTTEWVEDGVYSGVTGDTIVTQHFDKGNENIEMDITNEINNIIISGLTNFGYGISFDYELENLVTVPAQYVGFFTRHTQTYYEPYLETVYNDSIKDDRKNFYKNRTNRLYLYSNVNGEPKNLDNKPSLTILDNNGVVYTSFTSNQISQSTEGVYYANVFIPPTAEDGVLYFDNWGDIKIDGVHLNDIELDFEIKSDKDYYQIGTNESLPVDYTMSISGIRRDEKIKRGDIRKVMVSARIPYTINESEVIDNLQYRLWVREGNTQVNVIDWQDVNMAYLKNYFLIDTSWMIPNKYYIDIKLTSNQEVKTYTNQMMFDIVNQIDDLH